MASNADHQVPQAGPRPLIWPERGPFRRAKLPPIVSLIIIAAILYVGREVFLPIAIALLLTFILAPLVTVLRKTGLPRVVAVIATAITAFLVVGMFSILIAVQVNDLARNVSIYQYNVLTKVRTLKEAAASSGIVERISGVIESLSREIKRDETPTTASDQRKPLPVEVVTSQSPIEILRELLASSVRQLATAGLVIVVVIFMLLEREELRDRFIRLAGYEDLHRTTEALQEAGRRVGQYLRTQLVVNFIYAIPITIGLWLLGIPNALLWGLIALVLRFVPYVGPIIGAILPLTLALAISPGWYLVLWTALLFVAVELITNNVFEPWLYGSHTGLSPLAILVAAVFWTWIWGPLGLVLSTPLTVCLAVLGRHVPQFEFFDVLFGNEPVLEPRARLYQRFLVGDSGEATDQAEEILEKEYLITFYQEIGVPALVLAERDRARGALVDHQRQQVAASALALVNNLEAIAQQETAEKETVSVGAEEGNVIGNDGEASYPELPDGAGKSVLCIGGRSELDGAAAAMLAQALEVQGATISTASGVDLQPSKISSLNLASVQTVVIGFLDTDSQRHARFLVRRLKRVASSTRVGVVFWSGKTSDQNSTDMAGEIGADFVAFNIVDAARGALSDHPVEPYRVARQLVRRMPGGLPHTETAS